MKHHFYRGVFIALITSLLGSGVYYFTPLETTVGLDTLFKLRGVRTPPSEVVVVAMDEPSENRLGVGQDLRLWRKYHAKLIQQLQRQGAALVIFDLQFIKSYLGQDQLLASVMRDAGNVLIVDCLQKINEDEKEFSGREECSESNKLLPADNESGQVQQASDPSLLVLRKIPPKTLLAKSALDHAPFFLPNDAGNPVIREVWPFLDMFSKTPTLPVVAWLYYLQRVDGLTGIPQPSYPFSDWLTRQRKQCLSNLDETEPYSVSSREEMIFGASRKESFKYLLCLEDMVYIDFYGPPQTLRIESYSDVYDGKVSNLEGKVVFVGKSNRTFSPGKTDFFATPFTDTRSGEMAGVEIMATQFANLLEGRFITSPILPAILFVLYGLVVSLVLTCFLGVFGMAVSVILSGAYAGLAVWCFKQNGLWLPLLVPLLIQLPISCFISLFLSRQDLQKGINEIMPFVLEIFPERVTDLPESLRNWKPSKNTGQPSSEREVFGLCLATDIEGYTKIAENYSDHQLWELLQAYYQVLGNPIVFQQGNVANVQGDAMMAYWLKLPNDKHRYLACLAGLEMQLAVERFDENSSFDNFPTRIGLHEGSFVLGSGNAGRLKFSNPFGDTVNTASRIEGANRHLGTRILASSSIVNGLYDIISRPVGIFRVKGRAEPVELVEIMGLMSTIDVSKTELIEQFAIGLSAFQQGNWAEAELIFKTLLEKYSDGPSQFYWIYMSFYPGTPPIGWDGVVSLLDK
jgi:adenylate cyclase